MSISNRKPAASATQPVEAPAAPSILKKQKMVAWLVTTDDTLWPQIGADLSKDLSLKQLDSIDELIDASAAGQSALLLWDARGDTDPAAILSRLNLHSARYGIVILDTAGSAGGWTLPLQQRRIVAHVAVPLTGDALKRALDAATEEVNARSALLGDESLPPSEPPAPNSRKRLVAIGVGVMAIACLAVFVLTRNPGKPSAYVATPGVATPGVATPGVATPGVANSAPPTVAAPDNDERIDTLIEKAQQAMSDRHYVEPAAGSALSLYREVLLLDPSNGEAGQGLQRLNELLLARVQSSLDDRKFDVALQLLEIARGIDAADPRLALLDEKIAASRAELGPAQITAALNAQNFDRVAQLIDDALKAKTLAPAKAAQMREELHRRRDEFDTARFLKLIDGRLQQDRLLDPRNDSAAFYLEQARQAGTPAATLLPLTQELIKRLTVAVHAAVEQRRFGDADRFVTELRALGLPATSIAGLSHDVAAARALAAQPKVEQPRFLDLAQERLAQGRLLEAENDDALYYTLQARTQDPKNSNLNTLMATLQAQLLGLARAALDSGDAGKAAGILQKSATLGPSAELDSLNARIVAKTQAPGGSAAQTPTVPEQSLTRARALEVQYPIRAQQAGTEGSVDVGFTVNADGSVTNVKVINASPPAVFDTAATRAVKALRYQPVLQAGVPSSVNTQIKVVFRLPK